MMFNEKNVTVNEAWVNELAQCLQARFLDGTVVVTPKKVTKNNGVVLQGMEIAKTGESVAPILYVDQLEEDGLSAEEAADVVLQWYNRSCNPGFEVGNLSSMLGDWNRVKQYVIPVLINRSRNMELLEEVPHTFVGTDYVVIYKIRVPEVKDGLIKVTNSIFGAWNITIKELYHTALANLEKDDIHLFTMSEVFSAIFGEGMYDDVVDDSPLFVLRTESGTNGAAAILLESVQKEILAKFGGDDVCLLPSSIHEWIVVPSNDVTGISLAEMIQEVNQEVLRPEEILGDTPVYLLPDGVGALMPIFDDVLN